MFDHAPAKEHRVQFRFGRLPLGHHVLRDLIRPSPHPARAAPPQTERTSVAGPGLATDVRDRISRRFFFFCKMARASGSKSGAIITSEKISLMACASGSSIGRLQTMIPPNGACLSVANAFSQASRRSASEPTPHGLVCFRIATVGLRKFGDQIRGRADVENVVKGEFLAVKLFEMPFEIAVKRGGLMRIFAVTQTRHQRQRERKRSVGGLLLVQESCRSPDRSRKF